MTETSHPRAGAAANAVVWPAMITSAALVGQLIAGKATRDALFLTHFGVTWLPTAMIGAAILSALSVLVMTRRLSAVGPVRVLPATFAASAALFLLAWALHWQSERVTAIAVYAHTAIFNQAIGSAFWSLVNERFDPHAAKRLVGRIGSGGTVGGILGGLLVLGASVYGSVSALLVLLAAMSAVGWWGSLRLAPRAPPSMNAPALVMTGSFKPFSETPYLRDLALLVATGAVIQALLDWLFNAHASRLWQGQELVGFFAIFNVVASVLSLLAQLLLTRVVLERRGLGGAIKIQSLSVGAAAVVSLIAPVFATVIAARVVEQVTRASLYRAAYELFYTPLPNAKKRPTKMIIDVGVDRVGTALGSAGLIAVAHIGASATAAEQLELQTRVALAGLLALTAIALYIATRLQGGYVTALATSLKSGAIVLQDDEAQDLTTRRTLAETTAVLNRQKLLARIEEFQKQRSIAQAPEPQVALSAADGIEALLGHLLDPDVDPRVRRRIPAMLSGMRTQRAASGLVLALKDPVFEVRVQVATALRQLADGPGVELDFETVMDAVRHELRAGRSAWSAPSAGEGDTLRHGLAHVFAVLGLVLEREPLSIAHRALRSADPALRGTAFEYLEVVLPADLRDLLMPLLGDMKAPPRRRARGRKELAEELLKSRV